VVRGISGGDRRPRILGLGGTTRAGSTSERALRVALDAAAACGADVNLLPAAELDFLSYVPGRRLVGAAHRMIELVAACDGLIIATPAFHGGPSGLIKNALDHLEELRDDTRPYLDGRAVACIVCAAGWQATATTLVALRSTIHALRGWPTPLGVTINSTPRADGADPVEDARNQLEIAAGQVLDLARWRHAALDAAPAPFHRSARPSCRVA
jgi:FMN reductase